MTAQQIYELASSFLYEVDGEDADSKKFAVGFLNILLMETFPCEQSIREFRGIEPLTEPPFLTDINQDVPYQPELTRIALPYGLASWYFQEAMDNFQAENYRNKYLAAIADASKCNPGTVERM